MRCNTNHQETGPLFPISICEPCLRYRHHPLWPKQDRKRFRYEKHSWQVIKRRLIFNIFLFPLFWCRTRFLRGLSIGNLRCPRLRSGPLMTNFTLTKLVAYFIHTYVVLCVPICAPWMLAVLMSVWGAVEEADIKTCTAIERSLLYKL